MILRMCEAIVENVWLCVKHKMIFMTADRQAVPQVGRVGEMVHGCFEYGHNNQLFDAFITFTIRE